jgi:hypothetical protein
MKRLSAPGWSAAVLLILLPGAASGQAAAPAQTAWVQAVDGGGFEARLMTGAATCPVMHTDRGDVAMAVRAVADDKFPLLCAAKLAPGTSRADIAGKPLPVPAADPQRILVIGDTGCRLQGGTTQDCNTPEQWPFPQLAAAAARLRPDLVIHVGDYLYRETPCPRGDAGCAGSPYGDNGPAWQADFFAPAEPLLEAAPIVAARGNHEECGREGAGWLRLLGPLAHTPGAPCLNHIPMFTVDLGTLRLAVMDDASAPEMTVNQTDLPAYAAEIAALGQIAPPVWFVHHRPIWAAITGPLGIPIGGNRTLVRAAHDAAAAAGKDDPLIPPTVALQLSGHIHTFEAINYDRSVPPQIVAGNGGDLLQVTPLNLRGAIFQGPETVRVTSGVSVGGFGFLLMTRADDGWGIELFDSAGIPIRACHFTSARDGRDGHVDCPETK